MPVGVKQVGADENLEELEGCSPELFNRERLKRTRQLSKRTFRDYQSSFQLEEEDSNFAMLSISSPYFFAQLR